MPEINGDVEDGFEPVRDAFAAVAEQEGGDYAAQLVAYRDGERVVDLHTGIGPDAVTGVFSSTKGAAALVVALLVQDCGLDLDQRVSHYWPEFAAEGKGALTVRELMSHRAGVVGADGGFLVEELADDQVVAARLAPQKPYWRPGTAFGYHALTIGALANEVVRRVTDRSIQELYEERVRAPHGLDFYMGFPEEHEPRFLTTLPMLPTPEQQALLEANAAGPHSISGIAFNRNHPESADLQELPNFRIVREKGPASVGGVGSARGMAAMYAAVLGGLDGAEALLKADALAEVGQIHSIGTDLATRGPNAFGIGFSIASEEFPVLGQGAIGHSGAAGSFAFADPRSGLAYGYNRRRFAFPGGAAPENAPLVRAVHAAAHRSRRRS
ncbi:serine hydrolase domain-containing protein [Actinomycetes bacterium KLBMP 9759]